MADVAVSGSAEMGIIGGEDQTTQFLQSVDVRFSLSGETDNGLTFGAIIDLDDVTDSAREGRTRVDVSGLGLVDDDGNPIDTIVTNVSSSNGLGDVTGFADFTVFVSGDFGRITMGDTDGALDWAMMEVGDSAVGNPGSIFDNETGHIGYSGNGWLDGHYDGQVLRYDYTMGAFGVAISVEQDDNGTNFLDNLDVGIVQDPDVTGDPVWGLGARYTGEFGGGTFGVGIGYQFNNDAYQGGPLAPLDLEAAVTGLSAHVVLDSGFAAAVNYSMLDTNLANGDLTHFGIGASYSFDAISVHANYGVVDAGSALGAFDYVDSSGFGLAAAYDLGGGLSAKVGYGFSDVDGVADTSDWSLGLSMSF